MVEHERAGLRQKLGNRLELLCRSVQNDKGVSARTHFGRFPPQPLWHKIPQSAYRLGNGSYNATCG